MLTEICEYLLNYFPEHENGHDYIGGFRDVHRGKFSISGGAIEPLDFLKNGQYFRIVGSALNDGVYKYTPDFTGLTDEVFDGAIWAMAVPPSVIALCADIQKYNQDNSPSAFTSESFGGYSYSKATGANGAVLSWQTAFADRLKKWRKVI